MDATETCDFGRSWDRETRAWIPNNQCDGEVDWVCDDCEREGTRPGKCPGYSERPAGCGHESCGIDASHATGDYQCKQHQYLNKSGYYARSELGWP